jgi:hypothetical protein
MSLRDAQAWIPSKEHAWVRTPVIAFIQSTGELQVVNPENPDGDNLVLKQSDCHLLDDTHLESHDDLCKMNRLHDAPLLDVLRRRYNEENKIYSTASDHILVSVNPYKLIPGLYDNPLEFYDMPEGDEKFSSALTPHVYKVANLALYDMITASKQKNKPGQGHHINQSIVVSGESGAGKTEASKRVMTFLVKANVEIVKSSNPEAIGDVDLGGIAQRIQAEVVGSNLVFESFGNAKTVRNDNSSRFGKYIKLQYSDNNMLLSAYTDTFLLEKSRILSFNPGESNYHAFYYIVSDLQKQDPELATKFQLNDCNFENFRILTDSNDKCYWTDRGDEENLCALKDALDNVNFSKEEQNEIFQLLAAILHLGNVDVHADPEDMLKNTLSCSSISMTDLAGLLGLNESILLLKLTQRLVRIRGRSSVATKTLNSKEIKNNLNAFTKIIYSSIFSFIVRKINYAHSHPEQVAGTQADKFIGILDIFGFEIFKTNSFEQLCINYANERLQQHFNEHVFVGEKEQYLNEGIDASFITFMNNQTVIDLISKKPSGLFCTLDDFAKVNKTDDSQLIINFHQNHSTVTTCYTKPRINYQESFIVHHFAGNVTYTSGEDAESFLFKNNDALEDGLVEGICASENTFLKNIGSYSLDMPVDEGTAIGVVPEFNRRDFGDEAESLASAMGNASIKPPTAPAVQSKTMASSNTISKKFVKQVNRLMTTLSSTGPHYIKCMKPNNEKKPGLFNGPLMLEQLRYSGVLEVVRIRREGYPWSNSYLNFYNEFEFLGIKKIISGEFPHAYECSEEKARFCATEICSATLGLKLENVSENLYAFGNTRIFLREEGYNELSSRLNAFLDRCAARVQADIRRYRAVHWYKKAKRMVLRLQSWARMIPKITWKAKELARLAHIAALERKRLQEEEEERQRLAAIAAADAAEAAKLEAERQRILAEKEAERVAIEEADKEKLRLEQEAIAAEKKVIQDYLDAAEKGDVSSMKTMLESRPDLVSARTDKDSGKRYNAFQKACLGCSFDTIKYLNPAPHEIHTKDNTGNNTLLLLYSVANDKNGEDLLKISQYLSKGACENFPLEDSYGYDDYLTSRTDKWETADINTNAFQVAGKEESSAVVLKQGWLSKMHNTYLFSASWGKRWIILTDSSLLYFHDENDKLPKDSISLTKSTVKGMSLDFSAGPSGPAVTITLQGTQKSALKGRTQISLMASTTLEMEEWAKPLKSIMGMINGDEIIDENLANNWQYVSPVSRNSLLRSMQSNTKSSALHILANKPSGDNDKYLAQVSSWLIANGNPVDIKNSTNRNGDVIANGGVTPLEFALQNKNFILAFALISSGATYGPELVALAKDKFGETHEVSTLLKLSSSVQVDYMFHLPPPKLQAYTYLSIYFMESKFQNPKSVNLVDPCLTISVVNGRGELIQKLQHAAFPILKHTDKSIWWGKGWYLTTPLDNLANDAVVIVETRSSCLGGENYTLLGWSYFKLDRKVLLTTTNSDKLHFHPWDGSTNPSLTELSQLISAKPQMVDGDNGTDSSMEVEIVLERKDPENFDEQEKVLGINMS